MSKIERFKPVGEFSIDRGDCHGLKMCVILAHGTNLKVRKKDDKWEYTEVVEQPRTQAEQTLMIEGLAICPFEAGRINGDPHHAAFGRHDVAKKANPKLVEEAFADISRERKERRSIDNK